MTISTTTNWRPASERPDHQKYPYKPYLCWVRAPEGAPEQGVARVVRWVKEDQDWLAVDLIIKSQIGAYYVVVAWAEIERPQWIGSGLQ